MHRGADGVCWSVGLVVVLKVCEDGCCGEEDVEDVAPLHSEGGRALNACSGRLSPFCTFSGFEKVSLGGVPWVG